VICYFYCGRQFFYKASIFLMLSSIARTALDFGMLKPKAAWHIAAVLCAIFGVSERCCGYEAKSNAENKQIG
jgi:hypothetical protein